MTDIREYRKMRGNLKVVPSPEEALTSEELLIQKVHRRKIIITTGVIAFLVVLAVVIFYVITEAIGYSDYSVKWSLNREEGATAEYVSYGDGFIKYSNDGITYMNLSGDSIWNYTYSMKHPKVDMCGDCIAVADIDGTDVELYNEKGYLGSVDTAMLIRQAQVSATGLVAVVLEDENANYITMFNYNGDKIYSIKTTITGDGYPLDIAITDEGTRLMASFLYVSGETMKTNVVFYNFSEVGQNETERLVGGFSHYESTIVPEVEFLSTTRAIAIGENIVSIYNMKEYPTLESEIAINNRIEKVFFSSDYIGVVTENTEGNDGYLLTVYNSDGKKKFTYTFDEEYTNIKFDSKSVIMYNNSLFTIINMVGNEMYSAPLDLNIADILPTDSRGRYILIGSKYIQKIQMQ